MGEKKLKLLKTRADHRRALEENERKFELVNGEFVMMAGSRLYHNRIITNIKVESAKRIFSRGCDINSESLSVYPPFSQDAYIPDIVIHCPGEDAENNTVAENPIAIFEVLSPGRERYDREVKFAQYRRIPSLRHYVLISQEEPHVEHRHRTDAAADWQTEYLTRPEQRLAFSVVPFDLSLAQIYDRLPIA